MDSEKKYCMCCDETVPFHSLVRDGARGIACDYCGFVLDMIPEDQITTKIGCIIAADDSNMIRELIISQFLENNIAEEILTFPDGQQAVATITKRFSEGLSIDCVILDLEMPIMNGISCARIIRSLEKRFKIIPPTPFIFFSALTCSEDLRKKLSLFSPASYINKGKGSHPDQLSKRIKQLLGYLIKKNKAAAS